MPTHRTAITILQVNYRCYETSNLCWHTSPKTWPSCRSKQSYGTSKVGLWENLLFSNFHDQDGVSYILITDSTMTCRKHQSENTAESAAAVWQRRRASSRSSCILCIFWHECIYKIKYLLSTQREYKSYRPVRFRTALLLNNTPELWSSFTQNLWENVLQAPGSQAYADSNSVRCKAPIPASYIRWHM